MDPRPPLVSRERQHDQLYRTVLCRTHLERPGSCRYGDACMYAHGKEQLRKVDNREQLNRVVYDRVCHSFVFDDHCSYGVNCRYRHLTFNQLKPEEATYSVCHVPNKHDVLRVMEDLMRRGLM
ncbi:hypothetical protein L596_012880 [Steinernema carpocapsae]|uniref:C3H1-type domain-containing protein n=1 Tax=Steinernema carpocapsae TaxID=34508 RepID=A0A4U5NZD3_STECR|nr:hypothetical protein L596_012880 [Steinernema carpocapsae]